MQNSEEEFLKLYDDEADALYRFVFLRINDHDRALDIVQETYLRVWRALCEGGEIKVLRPFLFATARNLLIDTYRQDGRRQTDSLDRFFEEGGELEDDLLSTPYVQFDIDRAKQLLAELDPPEYREVILLRYVEELTPKEIAQAEGVSENVVSVRINRAMKKLQAQFNT
jgi:RNA polymerase sigma-70 factor (ECF subfamily)